MSDIDTRPDAAHTDVNTIGDTDSADKVENAPGAQPDGNADDSAGDTFSRSYVEDLRKENAGYRDRAKTAEERADALARRLHTALVRATGKLVDPDTLEFDAEHLDNDEKLSAAIEALTEAKPYLKACKVSGDAGQGARGTNPEPFNLLKALRGDR